MNDFRKKISQDLISGLSYCDQDESGWLRELRAKSIKRFSISGAPVQTDEEWRISSPEFFTKSDIVHDEEEIYDAISPFDDLNKIKIVFIDGIFCEEESQLPETDKVELISLEELSRTETHWAANIFGSIEEESQKVSKRPLAILNTAYSRSGFLVHVKENINIPIEFRYISRSSKSKALIRNFLKVNSGMEITLIEHFEGRGWSNILLEVQLEKRAVFNHFKFKTLSKNGCSNSFLIAKLEAACQLNSNSLSVGLGKSRNEAHVTLAGESANCSISGASYLGEGDTLDDDTISVHHVKPYCKSRQVFKKAQRANSLGVFQGKIRVENAAQKTDGYQTSRAILLDETSKFLAKPELEIFADDVSCSHGSVSGCIDAESLFYLQSRGISQEKAQNILILAFLSEVFDEIKDSQISSNIMNYMENLLDI